MKKVIIISCVLVLLSSTLVFAQSEGNGTIIGTFGIGGGISTTVQTAPQFSLIFDLNLISKTGFTICFADIIGARFSVPIAFSQHIMPGAGYHYLRDRWNIGGAIFISPMSSDLLFAGKVSGSYYFTDNIGTTGILMYRQTADFNWHLSMFDIFAGISIKLF
jgi:hypothetical protein